jgi:hypothetical protein
MELTGWNRDYARRALGTSSSKIRTFSAPLPRAYARALTTETALRWLIVSPIPRGCPRPLFPDLSKEATYPATRTFP